MLLLTVCVMHSDVHADGVTGRDEDKPPLKARVCEKPPNLFVQVISLFFESYISCQSTTQKTNGREHA